MHCAEKKGAAASRGSLLAETCIASTAFVRGLQEKALAEARSAAEEALKQRKASQGGASASSAGRPVCGFAGDLDLRLAAAYPIGCLAGCCWLVFRVQLAVAHHLLSCHSQASSS